MTEAARLIRGEPPTILGSEQSAAVRERLLAELGAIGSADLAASWARVALTAKNSLTVADAKLVEDAFEERLSRLGSPEGATSDDDGSGPPQAAVVSSHELAGIEPPGSYSAKGIDKSVLAIAAPRRYRNRDHLRYVARPALPDLRPQAVGPASPAPHAAGGARPQGQRRVRRPALPLHHRPCIGQGTSGRGGRPPASIRSRPPASSGGKPGNGRRRAGRRARREGPMV